VTTTRGPGVRLRHRVHGGDAAVAGDDQPRAGTLRRGDARGPEVVAVAQAVGHERLDPGARRAQHARQQGGGALPVDVVVAVHQDPVARTHGARDQRRGAPHVHPLEGIAQSRELRPQERARQGRLAHPPLHQQRGEGLRDAERGRERAGAPGVRRGLDVQPGHTYGRA
jgi:hypothetical protein